MRKQGRSLGLVLLLVCAMQPAFAQQTVTVYVPEVIATYPHDTTAYTQGLLLYDGLLYESTGEWGRSTLRAVDPQTGDVGRMIPLEDRYFGEGLARVGDRLIQLTWQENEAFVYDLNTFELLETFTYDGEGWGLCYDERVLYMSDGSQYLALRDAQTFELIFRGLVTYQGVPISQLTVGGRALQALNELECVGAYIYANVYLTDYILQIDKYDGQVVGVIDASGLLSDEEQAALSSGEVLNGIAYNAESDTFYITGKHWPKLFEVRFVPQPATPQP